MAATYDHASTLNAVLEAFGQKDIAGAIAHYDENATIVQYVDPPLEHSGRAAIESLLREMAEEVSDAAFEVITAVEDADRLAAEVVSRTTPNGASEPSVVRYGVFMEFHEGKIRAERLYLSEQTSEA